MVETQRAPMPEADSAPSPMTVREVRRALPSPISTVVESEVEVVPRLHSRKLEPLFDGTTSARMTEKAESERIKRKQAEEEEQANRQALEVREREAQLIHLGRVNTLGLLGAFGRMQEGLQDLAVRMNEQLKKETLDPETTMKVMAKFASAVQSLTGALNNLMVAERVFVGKPTAIVGVVSMSAEEAAREIEESQATLLRFREKQQRKLQEESQAALPPDSQQAS